jgi:hypothetical protein
VASPDQARIFSEIALRPSAGTQGKCTMEERRRVKMSGEANNEDENA